MRFRRVLQLCQVVLQVGRSSLPGKGRVTLWVKLAPEGRRSMPAESDQGLRAEGRTKVGGMRGEGSDIEGMKGRERGKSIGTQTGTGTTPVAVIGAAEIRTEREYETGTPAGIGTAHQNAVTKSESTQEVILGVMWSESCP